MFNLPIFSFWRRILTLLLLALLTACGGGSSGNGAAPGTNAALSGLTISTGVPAPVFDAATLAYTVNVNNATTSVTVTPTAADANASIKIDNVAVTSGSPSSAIALMVGDNPINIVVTAEDGTTTKTYTVTITRQAAVPNSDATLSNLTVSAGTLAPAFASASIAYTGLVPMASASLDITATTTSANATMTVNGAATASGALKNVAVPVGQSTITIVVTAQDGTTTKTYTITVTRPGITLTPASSNITAFSSASLTVTIAAASGTDMVVTLSSSSAAVTVPASVTVLAGNTQVAFSATSVASGAANATITATLGADAPAATVSVSGQCTLAADCPGTDTICQMRTCSSGTCGFSYATAGTVCSADSCTAGIIYPQSLCDGLGTCAPASSAACSDNNPCTVDACSGTSCAYPNVVDGTNCSLPNATGQCTSGACGISACSSGFKDCDANAATGCETDILNSTSNCGTCGNACVGGACVSGVCQSQVCGDGLVQGTEQCDDGDTTSGNGCSSVCQVENGWMCVGSTPSVCATNCGDGIVAGAEQCDDGNTNNGDGCTATCQLEGVCNGLPDGTPCNDGFFCTVSEVCIGGVCAAGIPVLCDDGNVCTDDVCDEASASCTYSPNNAVCDDGNECTADTCDLTSGCLSAPVVDGTACASNGGAACSGGICQ